MISRPSPPLAAILLLCIATPAAANPVRSRYTTIELKSCQQVKQHADGGAWICPGLPGYPVYLAERGLRQSMSFGPGPGSHRAATQTLRPFNTIFEKGGSRPTVEWRFTRSEGHDVPYATIVRYSTSNDGGRGRVLVVTKVGEAQSCQVARIDALANPDAIVLARQIADGEARAFDCNAEPRQAGAAGMSPM